MLPAIDAAAPDVPSTRAIGRYGYSSDFYSGATVHKKELCTLDIMGCMDADAVNYDSYATVDYGCYPYVAGCLNPMARNYGCTTTGESTCDIATTAVTVHSKGVCTFYVPTIVTNDLAADSITVTIETDGDVSSVTEAYKTAIATYIASQIEGVTVDMITVTVSGGSVVWTITVAALTPTQYEDFVYFEETALTSAAGAQGVLEASGVTGYTAATVSVATDNMAAYPPPSAPPSSNGGMIGGIIGGMSGCIFGVFGGLYWMKRKKGVAPS